MKNEFVDATYGEFLSSIAEQYALRDALVFEHRRYTFAEVKAEIDAASARLGSLRLRMGDTVRPLRNALNAACTASSTLVRVHPTILSAIFPVPAPLDPGFSGFFPDSGRSTAYETGKSRAIFLMLKAIASKYAWLRFRVSPM